jgi:hypothetical protein
MNFLHISSKGSEDLEVNFFKKSQDSKIVVGHFDTDNELLMAG